MIRTGVTCLTLAFVFGGIASAPPAAAAANVIADTPTVDIGSGWGPFFGGSSLIRNLGDPVALGSSTISEGFTLTQDTCAGTTLGAAGTCLVSGLVAAGAAPGERTGTISVRDTAGAVLATVDINVRVYAGVVAFGGTGNGVDRGEIIVHNSDTSTFNLTENFDGSNFAFWLSGFEERVTLGISAPGGALLTDDTVYDDIGAAGNGFLLVAMEGESCFGQPAQLAVDDVEYAGDGTITTLIAGFSSPCAGVSGVIAISSSPLGSSLWSPAAADLGSFLEPSLGNTVFAVNPGGSTLGTVAVDSTALNLRVTDDLCNNITLGPRSACAVRVEPTRSAPSGPVNGQITFDVGGETTTTTVESIRATLLLTTEQDTGNAAPRSTTISHLVDPVSISFPDQNSIEVSVSSGAEFSLASPSGVPLTIGTYDEVNDTRDSTAAISAKNCRPSGGSFVVNELERDAQGDITGADIAFDLEGCGTAFTGSLAYNVVPTRSAVAVDTDRLTFSYFDGTPPAVVVAVHNPGGTSYVPSISFVGRDPNAFWVSSTTCGDTLQPGSSCDVVIEHVPFGRARGSDTTEMLIASGASAPLAITIFWNTPIGWDWSDGTLDSVASGYWLVEDDGRVHSFGDARHLGNSALPSRVVTILATPFGRGYWVMDETGQVSAHGDAPTLGSLSSDQVAMFEPGELAISMSATGTSLGYWIFTSRGRVFPFGDAPVIGDLLGFDLAADIIASTAVPSGRGVYMLGSDGGVFTLGDAQFFGSVPQVLPGVVLDEPIVAMAADPDGSGYWLVAADGGVFAFEAGFRGSIPGVLAGVPLDAAINGMVPYGNAYLLVAGDGGTFNFSFLPFDGSLGGTGIGTIVGVAPVVVGGGRYQ